MTYIDTKILNRCKKELRILLKRDYCQERTRSILESFLAYPTGFGTNVGDEHEWSYKRYQQEREQEQDYQSWIAATVCSLLENDAPDDPLYLGTVYEIAPMAYAEYKVEFQRKKIKKHGSVLSPTGAKNLFDRELNRTSDMYPVPNNSYSLVLDTANAARGIEPRAHEDFWGEPMF